MLFIDPSFSLFSFNRIVQKKDKTSTMKLSVNNVVICIASLVALPTHLVHGAVVEYKVVEAETGKNIEVSTILDSQICIILISVVCSSLFNYDIFYSSFYTNYIIGRR